MDRLMSAHGVVALGIMEKVDTGHMDVVGGRDVTSAAAAVNDIRTSRGEKVFGMPNALHGVGENFRFSVVMLGQPFDLLDVKDGVTLHEGDRVLALFAGSLICL